MESQSQFQCSAPCKHDRIHLDDTARGRTSEFKRPTKNQRLKDASTNGVLPSTTRWPYVTGPAMFNDPNTFPAPLLLAGYYLDLDPKQTPQTVKDWLEAEYRNPVTTQRQSIYLVGSPSIGGNLAQMTDWSLPMSLHEGDKEQVTLAWPKLEKLQDYVSAFYHGMEVKTLTDTFSWQPFDHNKAQKKTHSSRYAHPKEQLVGLKSPHQIVGVRCRPSPDGVSRMQVNLQDIVGALMPNIPENAYAMLMLLNLDMYEDEDEIFTSGRAYGSSRVAVVSSFRDNPLLSSDDGQHRWPASHCAFFTEGKTSQKHQMPRTHPKTRGGNASLPSWGPIHSAVRDAATHQYAFDLTNHANDEHHHVEWLSRTAQTVTHELGHCLGIGHCPYFACVMQGCASSDEAIRQPPYLCPICLEKVSLALFQHENLAGTIDTNELNGHHPRQVYVRRRYAALLAVCERWAKADSSSSMFVGLKAWLELVLTSSMLVPAE
ncbi:metalloproteases (zincins), catalytic [Pochonia chlamydosporia 170]|uniref:Metalloproteases (Zincins), catalytic n=1 Tax=Pochonia chlamydosporia 170 TaxID=1380566 RepID=A0A179F2A1_METCM|nr:metalloproteases (zincins), catalytic [Pochonia chlamydosporia 170]OAQ59263.1 metalloproteases (zincins), catalytic [Pochonia chlamydosporia 170]